MRERRTLTSAYSAATKKPLASTRTNTSASLTSTDESEDSIRKSIIAGRATCRKRQALRYSVLKITEANKHGDTETRRKHGEGSVSLRLRVSVSPCLLFVLTSVRAAQKFQALDQRRVFE